jgi:hypothetical protein
MEFLFHLAANAIEKALASPYPVLATLAVLVGSAVAVRFLKWLVESSREPDRGECDESGEDEDTDQDERP